MAIPRRTAALRINSSLQIDPDVSIERILGTWGQVDLDDPYPTPAPAKPRLPFAMAGPDGPA